MKEKDIEGKLSQIVAEWTVQTLQFSTFKMRGELLLKGSETQEIVTVMEDSLMMLSSLLSNRYSILHSTVPIQLFHFSVQTQIIHKYINSFCLNDCRYCCDSAVSNTCPFHYIISAIMIINTRHYACL